MKFNANNKAVVWDAEKKRALIRAKDGYFETDDLRITGILKDRGYKPVGKQSGVKGPVEMSVKELRELAVAKKILTADQASFLKKNELLEKLNSEAEN